MASGKDKREKCGNKYMCVAGDMEFRSMCFVSVARSGHAAISQNKARDAYETLDVVVARCRLRDCVHKPKET